MKKQLRLLKVMVQPVFVVDDGETLTELPTQAIAVPVAHWPDYATTEFIDAMEQLRQQIETQR